MSNTTVKYIDSIRSIGNENFPVYKTLKVDTDFVRSYYNMYASLAGLNPCSRDLMDFLTKEMDDNNIVRSDVYVRTKFLDYIKSLKKARERDGKLLSYADSNVKKAFKTLSLNECLIPISKGIFKVNPKIYFKKSDEKRLQSIKVTMEFIKGHRDANMSLQCSLMEDVIDEELKETANIQGNDIEPNYNFAKDIQDESTDNK